MVHVNYRTEKATVSGRELHAALEIKTAYKDWFPRMCDYGFTEEKDFCSILSESTGGRPSTDHAITIPMAKELCMLQRSDKGRLFRKYFIACEEAWNSPEKIMERALQMARQRVIEAEKRIFILNEVVSTQSQHITELKPKALFADAVSASETSILVGDMAKLLKQNGYNTGQKRFFAWLRGNGYLMKSGKSSNVPTQYSMDLGLFEIRETTITLPSGKPKIEKTPMVTGKGQIYFITKLCKNKAS